MRVVALALAAALAATLALEAQQQQPRPPVFRGGAHYVRVDAYPVSKDGKIVEGLGKDDFEIYEDGKLQTIDSSAFVTFDTWTPEGERKDPRTQQDAYDLAADPGWRVFVVVIDPAAYDMQGRHYLRAPLHNFIDRNLGPRDLFGLLSTENDWTDLVLGQSTTAANHVIDGEQWLDPDRISDKYWPLVECGLENLIPLKKLDDQYRLLEGLVKLLGQIRQERKGIILVSNGLGSNVNRRASSGGGMGLGDIPRIGITRGRIGDVTRGDRIGGTARSFCANLRMELTNLDLRERFRDLLKEAREGNVAFYPVSPLGLQAIPFKETGGADLAAFHRQTARNDQLITLANETGGLAIVNTNDLAGGLKRISSDIQAYYVLGYYTSNTTWDGRVRSIKVKLKPKGNTVRARRQYKAPTMAEIAAISNPAPARLPTAEEDALAALSRARRDAPFLSYAANRGSEMAVVLEVPARTSAWDAGTEVTVLAEAGDGTGTGSARQVLRSNARTVVIRVPIVADRPPVAGLIKVRSEGMVFTDRVALPAPARLIGDALLFRNGSPVAVLTCTRSDAVRLEWPLLAPVAEIGARLLDRRGQPIRITVKVDRSGDHVVTETRLAPLGRGDYLLELSAAAAGTTERKLVSFRVE